MTTRNQKNQSWNDGFVIFESGIFEHNLKIYWEFFKEKCCVFETFRLNFQAILNHNLVSENRSDFSIAIDLGKAEHFRDTQINVWQKLVGVGAIYTSY